VDRLRADIDRGKTGDKAPAADPAAAPLGTDDEFADVSPASSLAARTQAREIETGAAHPPQRMRGLGHASILVGVTVLMAVAELRRVLHLFAQFSGLVR
jgi:hypothetical protein